MTGFPPPGAPPPPGSVPAAGSGPLASAHAPAAARAASLFLAQRPGVVPLRPLTLGDLYDGAVRTVRANPRTTVGVSAVVTAVFLIPAALLEAWLTGRNDGAGEAEVAGLFSAIGQGLAVQAATVLLTGVLVHVVSEAVLGRHPDLTATWRRTRGRLLPLIGLNLLVGLALALAVGLLALAPVLLLVAGRTGTGVILLVVAVPLAVAAVLWIQTRSCLASPALVLERGGVLTSLRRSWALTSGQQFWRLLGITLLTAFVVGVASALLAAPFTLIGPLALQAAGLGEHEVALAQLFLTQLGELLTSAVMTPFAAAVTCLLYVDQRIRREALDLTLVRAAQSQPDGR